MTQLSELNRISIAQIAVYTPSLFIAILLATRHGFGRNAGWLYLILFSVVRILGSALELATINDPTNIGLIIGSATLQTIGLSPLILVGLGLTGRVLESISSQGRSTLLPPRALRLVQILVLVGLILGIVGGNQLASTISSSSPAKNGASANYAIPTTSQAGLALMIAGYGLLAVSVTLLGFQVASAEKGEKRLLLAVAAALPFILVRLIFSAIGIFGTDPNFRQYGNSPNYATYLLAMAVIMEMIAIAIFEVVGLTLRQIPKGERKSAADAVPLGNYRLGGGRRQRHQGAYQQEQGVSQV